MRSAISGYVECHAYLISYVSYMPTCLQLLFVWIPSAPKSAEGVCCGSTGDQAPYTKVTLALVNILQTTHASILMKMTYQSYYADLFGPSNTFVDIPSTLLFLTSQLASTAVHTAALHHAPEKQIHAETYHFRNSL